MGSFWSQPLRVECRDMPQLITCRCIISRLWFVNNPQFEQRVLAYLAKYVEKYGVILYAFVLVGNHYHILAAFPLGNRSQFFRDFNARIAESLRYHCKEFLGGPLFERRFTPQVLPLEPDLEKYFYYCALQPVSSGLTPTLSAYTSYNSFSAAASQRSQTFTLFNFSKYRAALRTNPKAARKDFIEEYQLRYQPLPQLAHLSKNEYKKTLLSAVEERRLEIVAQRLAEGKQFLGRARLLEVGPGSLPHSTKRGGIRPLVLSCCKEAKRRYLDYYFSIVAAYRHAVAQYRRGIFDVAFPPGTFRPPGLCISPP